MSRIRPPQQFYLYSAVNLRESCDVLTNSFADFDNLEYVEMKQINFVGMLELACTHKL